MRKSVGLAAALVAYGSFLADAEAAYTVPYRYISPEGMRHFCWWQGGNPWSKTQSYGCVAATRAYECSVRSSQCSMTVYDGGGGGVFVVPLPLGGGHKHPPYSPPPTKQPPGKPPVIPPGGTVVFPPKGPSGGGGTVVFPPKGPSGGGTVVFPPKSGSAGGGKPPPGGGSPSGGGSPIKQN